MKKRSTPATIDDYLAAVSDEKRATLNALRKAIHAAAPKAEECISYGVPAFRLNGRMLVWFGGGANHCSFYPGAYPIQKYKSDLKAYKTSKGTLRFDVGTPLPPALVKKLVRARIAERTRT